MNKQEYETLFKSLYPDFLTSETVRGMSEDEVYEEMLLPLSEFDFSVYPQKPDDSVSFNMCLNAGYALPHKFCFYEGGADELKKAVEKVDRDWVQFFGADSRVFCGFVNGEIASFCLVDDMGRYSVNGRMVKVGGPGCVGTVPAFRNKGIGLTMVKLVTQLLREEGFDYSYIHFTGVAKWYEKLGYKTIIKWDKNGIIDD